MKIMVQYSVHCKYQVGQIEYLQYSKMIEDGRNSKLNRRSTCVGRLG